jgi:phosphotriesterase-related protein
MLSHDRGWYDPAKPGGGVPKLRAIKLDEETIHQFTQTNVYRAFARCNLDNMCVFRLIKENIL